MQVQLITLVIYRHHFFEGENANGSVLCNTYQTKEFIKENFELFGDLVQYCKDNWDMTLNPFSEPEKINFDGKSQTSSFKDKPDEVKQRHNYKFANLHDDNLESYPNIETLIFERKN